MPAERIGMVDLVVAVAADLDTRIARDREQRRTPVLLIDGGKHQRIAAPDILLPVVNPHDEHIAQLMFRQIGECIHIAQRAGHEVTACVVNAADEQKGQREYAPRIFDKRAALHSMRSFFL